MSTTTARVKVIVDIDVKSRWHESSTIGQVRKQAAEDAINALRQGLIINGLKTSLGGGGEMVGRVVGEPSVLVVMFTREGEGEDGGGSR